MNFSEHPNILSKDVNGEYLAKGTQKCKIFSRLMGKELENLDDQGCPKFRDLVDPGADGGLWICSSYPFRHKTTLNCGERKAKVLCNWARQLLNLLFCVVERNITIYVNKSFEKNQSFFRDTLLSN